MSEVRGTDLFAARVARCYPAPRNADVRLQPSPAYRHELPHLSGQPDPKSRSLARGERRYRRKVASPKQWQAIIAAKGDVCRLTAGANDLHRLHHDPVQYHHLVPRDMGGDDVEDNIVPLCPIDHDLVETRHKLALYRLAESLTDAEYAYVVGKLGESGPARLFGVGR